MELMNRAPAEPKSSPAAALPGDGSCSVFLAFLLPGAVCLSAPQALCFYRQVLHLPAFFPSAELVLMEALGGEPGVHSKHFVH